MEPTPKLPDTVCERLRPLKTALVEWLAPQLDDACLKEISEADWGEGAQDNLRMLKAIRDGSSAQSAQLCALQEVLELVRNSQPDNPEYRYCSPGRRGHLIRAFCCALLVWSGDDSEASYTLLSENSTLLQLIAGAIALGPDAVERTVRLLSWRAARLSEDRDDIPLFALALVLSCAASASGSRSDNCLGQLARWASACANHYGIEQTWSGMSCSLHDWNRLIEQLLVDPAHDLPAPTADAVLDLAALYLG